MRGNILYQTDAALINKNPLRYRGYIYDTETGFYYLQSRYYDPKIGRWINADSYASTGQGFVGYNMYAYCNNSPVKYSDAGGNMREEAPIYFGDDYVDVFLDAVSDERRKERYQPILTYAGKIGESGMAVLTSVEVDAGVGIGLGADTSVCQILELSAIQKIDILAFHYSYEEGIAVRLKYEESYGSSVLNWNMGEYYSSFFPLFNFGGTVVEESFGRTNSIGASVGAYTGVRASASISWNLDRINEQLQLIWSE